MSTIPLPGAAEIRRLARRCRGAIEESAEKLHLYRGWMALQEKNADGEPIGPLPYTDEAITEFEAAHNCDPEASGTTHHLAIAHHARAWDRELEGGSGAAADWERALELWRRLVGSADFWAGLQRRFQECQPGATATPLPSLRRGLLEGLLDIHVDFVRWYSESATPERANDHIAIVAGASIPRALKQQLTEKIFAAMAAPVPDARLAQDYSSALQLLERFLALFPGYLPALRMHLEVCHEWAGALMSAQQWDQLYALELRARPYAERLAAHPEYAGEPLFRHGVGQFGSTVGHATLERDWGGNPDWAELEDRSERAIWWVRLVWPFEDMRFDLRLLFVILLAEHARALFYQADEIYGSGQLSDEQRHAGAIARLRQALAELEEAFELTERGEQMADSLSQNIAGSRLFLERVQAEAERKRAKRVFGVLP